MKGFSLKSLLPHAIAIGVFLLVALIFCKPALESNVAIKQADMISVEGMRHQLDVYKEKNGNFPLWVSNMFSGMPAYQIAYEGHWNPLSIVDNTMQLWLPQPLNFFFLACICFYILCLCIGIRPYAAILGSLAFAYSTYNPIIITAGHVTKMLAMAYSPAMLGAAILIFKRKYMLGFSLLMLFTALQVLQNHQQVTFYVLIIMLFMAIAFAIQSIMNKEMAHLLKSAGLMITAGVIGVAVSAISLLTIYDFSKYSKRGGMLVMDKSSAKGEKVEGGKTKGLSKDYAFQWSYGKTETWSLMFPGVMGYGTHVADRDGEQYVFPKLGAESNLAAFLTDNLNQPPDAAEQIAMQQSTALYWGDQPFTNGPVYLGAVICFLFILGMFMLDNRHKWWILASCVIAVMLAWGSNFPSFNNWIFDNVPLYNKFRVPTMTLIIPQMLMPLLASMVLEKLLNGDISKEWDAFKKGMIGTAVIMALGVFTYMSADYSKENRQRTTEFNKLLDQNEPDINGKLAGMGEAYRPSTDNQLYEGLVMNLKGSPDAKKTAKELVSALRQDRKALFSADLIRSGLYILGAALLIGLFLRRRFVNASILMAGLTLLTAADLLGIGNEYLNRYSFEDKNAITENEFPMTDADKQIINDTDPNFRVFNSRGLDESRTSYYHKSIGGYHPAKLGIYDDLLAHQLNGNTNPSVINMLNTKYVIQQMGNNPPVALPNPGALGNVWLVKGITWVNGPVEEMKALDAFNPKDTLIIDESFRKEAGTPGSADSADAIKMTKFDNDRIDYESNTKEPRIAVFSEIYYKDWNAYVDDKPASFFKGNYVLRGMLLPAGKHNISFRFEPTIFFLGKKISLIASWITFLLFIATMYLWWKKRDQMA